MTTKIDHRSDPVFQRHHEIALLHEALMGLYLDLAADECERGEPFAVAEAVRNSNAADRKARHHFRMAGGGRD
jgi:hypothetical protein